MTRTECPFPEKERLTKLAAKGRARFLNAHRFDGRRVVPYRCPATGHYHVGHPDRLARLARLARKQQRRAAS